jgi:hypothetical protein
MSRDRDNSIGRSTDVHLSYARLASVASGVAATSGEELHLAGCRQCAALYAELVHLRGLELTGEFEAPQELLAAGHEFIRSRASSTAATPSPAGTLVASRARRVASRLAPALAIAALLILAVGRNFIAPGPTTVELPEVLRLALIEDSAHGLVHPLVADAAAFNAPVLRGAEPRANALSTDLIDEMQERLRSDPESGPASAVLVATFQAADQLRNARVFLDAAVEAHPRDSELAMLEIIQDFREGSLPQAEAALRGRITGAAGDDLARLNLAILLLERGDPASRQESRQLATELAERLAGTGLGQRAAKLLD